MFIVSDNNVGKTRVLSSIDNFFNGKENSNMEVRFELTETEIIAFRNKYDIDFESDTVLVQNDKKIYFRELDITTHVKNDKVFGKCFLIPTIIDYSSEADIKKSKSQLSEVLMDLVSDDRKLSNSLGKLNRTYDEHLTALKEKSRSLFDEINNSILFNEIKVDLKGEDIQNNQILKNNLSLYYTENGNFAEFERLGAGVQANIICSILSSKPRNQFTLILYDEPESFLNSTKQKEIINQLSANLKTSQYIIATHSPFIVTRDINTISAIVRLKRNGNAVSVYQFDEQIYRRRIDEVNQFLQTHGAAAKYLLKDNFMKTILVWWETERINALFTNKILLVEGPTEVIFVDVCMREFSITSINCIGKFKIPYFKILFEELLGIEIVVMYDKDDPIKNRNHGAFNSWISGNITKYIELDKCIEDELKYIPNKDVYQKPSDLMDKILSSRRKNEISELVQKIRDVWSN